MIPFSRIYSIYTHVLLSFSHIDDQRQDYLLAGTSPILCIRFERFRNSGR